MKLLNGADLQGNRITQLGDPSAATDAANKQYVDNVARGLSWKQAVRAATTANGALATAYAAGQSIDGVVLAAGDRILIKNQTAGEQNGIYVVGAGAPTRALDADNGTELAPGTAVTVTEGTANGDKAFLITSDAGITIGTTAMTWSQLGGGTGTTYTGSSGVQVSGSNITGVAAASGGLTVGAAGFAIDTNIVARKVSGTIGNGALTTIAVTHNLGTKDVSVTNRLVATDELVLTDWVATDINTVTFSFGSAPANASIRFTIIG